MGWDFHHAKHYKNGRVDRKKEVDEQYTWKNRNKDVSVLKSVMVGTDYFAAIKVIENGNESVEAVMCLTKGRDRSDPWFNIGVKSIPHTDSDHCPMSIIKLLSPSDDEREMKWRRDCEVYSKKPKLKDLPVGTMITFDWWDGTKYTLEKMPPKYQFKRCWWYDAERNYYMPSNRIPSNFAILED